MLKRHHCVINCQKMRNNMPCAWMDPVVLWEKIRGERLLYGALQVTETAEGQGELKKFVEVKAIQLTLDIVE